jgi:caffeic acid 3-O-methyltransferase
MSFIQFSEESKAEGVEYLVADMFDPRTFPESFDVIYMKYILHDWSDEDCIKILKSCHEASDDNVTIVINDAVVPSAREIQQDANKKNARTLMGDMIMMLIGGKERTKKQWNALAHSAGFVVTNVQVPPTPSPPFITLKKA